MDTIQTNKANMYRTVAKSMTRNTTLTSTVPAIARQVTALQSTIATIDALSQAQEASKKGITQDKTNITQILVDTTLGVAGAVAAWASENNNEEVRAKMTMSPTSLAGSKDRQIPTTAKMVADEAAKHDLTDYGAGPLTVEALNTKIEAYHAIMNAPRDAIVATTGMTSALAGQFTLGDKIVKERLDKLMEQFRTSQPQFFTEYKSARTIVDRGGAQSVTPTPAPGSTKTTTAAPATGATA